ncbi:hypothetical protein N431DRAFT_489814 [Stipitochalara longipes BDJ]|nr:hypothetical protein N431DRAFT_489814 [Stipitochalara longipes BDJ]
MAALRLSRTQLQRCVAALEKELRRKDKKIADAEKLANTLMEDLQDHSEERKSLFDRVEELEKELRKKDKRIADTEELVNRLMADIGDGSEERETLLDRVEELETREEERIARGCAGCTMHDVIVDGYITRYVYHNHGPNSGAAVVPPPVQAQQVIVHNYYPPVCCVARVPVPVPVVRRQMRIGY